MFALVRSCHDGPDVTVAMGTVEELEALREFEVKKFGRMVLLDEAVRRKYTSEELTTRGDELVEAVLPMVRARLALYKIERVY